VKERSPAENACVELLYRASISAFCPRVFIALSSSTNIGRSCDVGIDHCGVSGPLSLSIGGMEDNELVSSCTCLNIVEGEKALQLLAVGRGVWLDACGVDCDGRINVLGTKSKPPHIGVCPAQFYQHLQRRECGEVYFRHALYWKDSIPAFALPILYERRMAAPCGL